jgi:hypothetical protein
MVGKRAKCPRCEKIFKIELPAESATQKDGSEAAKPEKKRPKKLTVKIPRESATYAKVRQEVLADIDAEDCRVSVATPDQMVNAIGDRGLAAILITIPWNDLVNFHSLEGVAFNVAYSKALPKQKMESVISVHALSILSGKSK